MALQPYISVHDDAVVLSLDVVNRVAVGWQLVNNSGVQVEVELVVNGNRLITVPFAPGTHSGTIARNRQWNLDDENVRRDAGVTVRW